MRTISQLKPLIPGIKHGTGRSSKILPIIFGILIGLFLGHILDFEHETEIDTITKSKINDLYSHKIPDAEKDIYLRCIILIQKKPNKFIEAVKDTYGKRCNETLYFTSIKKLEENFVGQLEIYHIGGNLDPRKYHIFHEILAYTSGMKKKYKNIWSIFLNEQNYLVTANMRHFLSRLSIEKFIIVGRISNIKSFYDYIFPFSSTVMFDINAGLAMSEAAVEKIIQNQYSCSPSHWGIPSYTGKALLQCCKALNFEIWDPVDTENKRLFLSKSPRNLFATSQYAVFGKTFEESQKISECCSDSAIVFGLVNYRDQRVIDYTLEKTRVFGI
uniref:Uncharacterized protein n=1 Tax=Panagrolaimus sp. PS1159 TaxID=55785 RepID=A0AC35FSL7_9BILA